MMDGFGWCDKWIRDEIWSWDSLVGCVVGRIGLNWP